MEEEYALLIDENAQAVVKDPTVHFSKLTMAAFNYVQQHFSRGSPLVLPAEVAIVYVADPNVRPIHDCAECGYPIPFAWAQPLADPPRPGAVYFDCCPLRGGRVGWNAYFCSHHPAN